MKLKEVIGSLSEKYKEYIVIIKSGTFYNVFGTDCYVMRNIFHYKINPFSSTIKVGFPLQTLNKVLTKLEHLKINYIVYENEIVMKKKYNNNFYREYLKQNLTLDERIEQIYFQLKEVKFQKNILEVLDQIERLL